jgi:acyl dehydratase
MQAGRKLAWGDLSVGMLVDAPFSVDERRMREFAELSGDNSRIHRDCEFARNNGFEDRVVYGALQAAQLSYVIGMLVPGDLGLATGWQFNFRSPLYIGDQAVFQAEVTHLSEATRIITLKFKVSVGSRIVATGSAQSKLLQDDGARSEDAGVHE